MSTKNNSPQPVIIKRTFNAPIAQVWEAISTNEGIKHWFFKLKEFKPQVGFKFGFTAEKDGFKYTHHCKIVEVVPGKKIAYSWRYEGYEGDSLVTYELFAKGRKTQLKLTHTGLETFPTLPDFAKKNFIAGWTFIIGTSLMKYIEEEFNTA